MMWALYEVPHRPVEVDDIREIVQGYLIMRGNWRL